MILDIPVEDLVLLNKGFKRYIHILKEEDINTSSEMLKAYVSCNLDHINGLGRKFFSLAKDLLDNQKKYKRLYDNLMGKTPEEGKEQDETRE